MEATTKPTAQAQYGMAIRIFAGFLYCFYAILALQIAYDAWQYFRAETETDFLYRVLLARILFAVPTGSALWLFLQNLREGRLVQALFLGVVISPMVALGSRAYLEGEAWATAPWKMVIFWPLVLVALSGTRNRVLAKLSSTDIPGQNQSVPARGSRLSRTLALMIGILIIPASVAMAYFLLQRETLSRIETTALGGYQQALEYLNQADSEQSRFYALPAAAKASFVVGDLKKADQYAQELLALAPSFPKDWNYGNAIHDGNLVLGRIAVAKHDLTSAKAFLKKAGETPGSPQLGSFGPNMSLARDLVLHGEKEAVLEYFMTCRRFWEMGDWSLRLWTWEINLGLTPTFGSNLLF